jgi:hypothetical protein
MKNKKTQFLISAVLTVSTALFSACTAASTVSPTQNPADFQNTAIAAAFTLLAETQAAVPTYTPVPPTETPTQTPIPTNTPVTLITETSISSPTIQVVAILPTATPDASNKDECNKPISGFSGPGTTIRVVNNSGLPIAVWFQVVKTAFGDCGYAIIPPLAPGADYSFNVPQSCYAAGAWTTGEKKLTIDHVQYPLCANNPDKWTLVIKKDLITLESP